jgi:LuxR family transcriptional regulator
MELEEYLLKITRAEDLEALWPLHVRQMSRFGFTRLIYGYTVFKTKNSLGDPDDFVILSNHDKVYVDRFIGEGLYLNAPMMGWALENEGAASWSQGHNAYELGRLSAAQTEVYEFNQRMGVTAGYTISFNSPSHRFKGAIAMAARHGMSQADVDELWLEHGDVLTVMNNVLHLKILSLPYRAPNRSLTRRQREVLQWVGDGKTTQDIAVLLGLTPATVEKHLRLARQSLSVETTAQAVLKAALNKQMYVLD